MLMLSKIGQVLLVQARKKLLIDLLEWEFCRQKIKIENTDNPIFTEITWKFSTVRVNNDYNKLNFFTSFSL